MIVYFSGTGNSRFAAEFLSRQLDDELLDAGRRIKTGERDSILSDRPWVFAAPVYGLAHGQCYDRVYSSHRIDR